MSAQNDIESSLAAYNAENDKFNKGNAAAGTRSWKQVKSHRNYLLLGWQWHGSE